MHLSIKDQTRHETQAIMCVEKSIRVCIVLSATPEQTEIFATLADALGVTEILCIAPREKLEEYFASGWVPKLESHLLTKKLKGGK